MRIISTMLLVFAVLAGGYRFLASIIVKDGAEVMFADEGCPVQRMPDKICSMTGSVSTDFVSGDLVITTKDATWLIPQTHVRGMSYPSGQARYEVQPAAGVFLLAVLGFAGCVGAALWCACRPRNRH